MDFLITQFTNFLLFINSYVGSLGISIIIFTIAIKSILMPLTIQSMKTQNKIKLLNPELEKLKKKHKNNKQALQQAQLGLYQKNNVNPMAGCLPQIVQIFFLIVLYKALMNFLGNEHLSETISTSFLWLDLAVPDPKYILPVLAAVSQLVMSVMIAPGAEKRDIIPNNSKSKQIQQANKKEEDSSEMAAMMQQQMLYVMPVMTGLFAAGFPSGLALYWVISTLFTLVQQLVISGPGGLTTYYYRVQKLIIKTNK